MKTKLYQMIADDLTLAIDHGELKPGSEVWSLKEIRKRYGVSHLTALKSLKILADQHRIERKNGVRYRVVYPENNRSGNRILSVFRMLSEYDVYDNFGNRIISGIQRGCLQKGFCVTSPPGVIAVSGRFPLESEVRHIAEEIAEEKNCAGILFDMRFSDEMLEKYLLPVCGSTPCVLVGRSSKLPIPTVSAPNRECGEAAAKLALHTNADHYMILGVEGVSDQDLFVQSFSETLLREEVEPRRIHMVGPYKMNNSSANTVLLDDLLHQVKENGGRTFVISLSSFAARWICNLFLKNGLRLHSDFSLLSYGGFEISYNFKPKIAEIAINAEEIGYLAAEVVTGIGGSFQKEHYCGYKIDFNETL